MASDVSKAVPRKRPDRSAKLQNRKHEEETVVKCSLKGLLRGDDVLGGRRDALLSAITARVAAFSQRMCNASVALNLLLQQAFHGADDVTLVAPPSFSEQSFVRQLMLGTEDDLNPIKELHARFPSLLHDVDERHLGDRNVYSSGAIKYLTNTKVHLTSNSLKMIKRLVYACCPDREQAIRALFAIHGWEGVPPASDQQTLELVSQARRILGLADNQGITKAWLKDPKNIPAFVRLIVFANRKLESLASSGVRLCTLAPLCTLRSHFATFDSSVLYGVMKEVGLVACNQKEFDAHRDAHWHSVFKIGKVTGRGCKFTGTIETDGVSACVHFTRPKRVREPERDSQEDSRACSVGGRLDTESTRVLANDPGRCNIFYVVEKRRDGEFKSWRLTRRQYYNESGSNEAQRRASRWQAGLRMHVEELSVSSPRTASLPRFLCFLGTWLCTRAAIWEEHSKRRWAEQRLRVYGGKKRVFARFFNRLEAEKEERDVRQTTLAYGSARFAPGGKGEVSVPTTRAFKEAQSRFRVVVVDEFRTSQVYHGDESQLQKVGRASSGGVEVVRGLLWCGSTSDIGKFVSRDKNAAINILRCVTLPKRPTSLTRCRNQACLPPQRVVRVI